jgi:excisionase family DNA binding protein
MHQDASAVNRADYPRPIAVRPREAAKLVGCGERMIRALVSTGELKSRKVGSMRLIPYHELVRLFGGDSERESSAGEY